MSNKKRRRRLPRNATADPSGPPSTAGRDASSSSAQADDRPPEVPADELSPAATQPEVDASAEETSADAERSAAQSDANPEHGDPQVNAQADNAEGQDASAFSNEANDADPETGREAGGLDATRPSTEKVKPEPQAEPEAETEAEPEAEAEAEAGAEAAESGVGRRPVARDDNAADADNATAPDASGHAVTGSSAPDVDTDTGETVDDDMTRITGTPAREAPAAGYGDEDVTRITGTGSMAVGNDDVTRVTWQGGQHPGAASSGDDVTHVQGSSHSGTGTQSRRADHSNGSSWRHLSDLAVDTHVAVGSLLKGRFLLEREIGRGGMGVVFLARDARKVEAHDRNPHIAVKVLNDEFRKHPDSLIALQRESMRAQVLTHDHVVRVYDFDKDGGVVFMTMEYIDGVDLRALIRSRKGTGMSFRRAWPLLRGMGQALQRAHQAGIVHSDFKPGNVMVTQDNEAKVFDFGIARAAKFAGADSGTDGEDHTMFDASSLRAMTPAYASLQMLEGRDPAFSDDVYAFGCVAYELLAGHHPFDKETAEQAKARGRSPKPIEGLTRRQNKVLARCLAFEEGLRPSMSEALEELRPRTRAERVLPYVVGSVLGLIVLVGGGSAVMSWHQQKQVETVLARFSPQSPEHFKDEVEAGTALAALDQNDRRRVLVDSNSVVESFLLTRLGLYWDPERGRLDYAGARRVFDLRDQWKLFSPRLDERRTRILQARDEQLNALDTSLNDAIARGALLQDQPDNVLPVLASIRSLAPDSGLLRSRDLERRYLAGTNKALAEGDHAEARRWVASGLQAFPDSDELIARDNALNGKSGRVNNSAAVSQGDQAPDERASVEDEVAARIESLRTAAAASDVSKAEDLLQAIRTLQPDNAFLVGEGRRLLISAYLGRAASIAATGRWNEASVMLRQAVSRNDVPQLRRAQARYAFANDLLQASAGGTLDTATAQRLRTRLDALRRQDGPGFRQFETEIAQMPRNGATVRVVDGLAQLARTVPEVPAVASATATSGNGCAARHLPGTGNTCFDALRDGTQAPLLVVVPGGDSTIAMMRNELTMQELALFCAQTRECQIASRATRSPAAADEISGALIQRYAAWLSTQTGHRYRLPTDGEWLRAARAGSSVEACELAVSNRWGLRNMAGGVGEWVTSGGRLGVRGGRRESGACGPGGMQASDGGAKRGIGARLVREL